MKFIYISNDWKCSMAKVYLEYNFVCVLISESNKGAVAPAAGPVDRSPDSQKFYCFWTTSHPIPTTNLLYNLALLSIVHMAPRLRLVTVSYPDFVQQLDTLNKVR